MARTLIRGGRMLGPDTDTVADVLADDGRIVAIGRDLDTSAELVIDARDQYVLPGAIDVHTHMSMPFGGTMTCDDFTTGTIAAAHGGTTTIVDFAIQQPGQSLTQTLALWQAKLVSTPPVADVGFHIAVTDLSDAGARLSELEQMPAAGVSSIKMFMAYKGGLMVDDATLFEVMRVAARTGALVLVHAENGDAIDILVREALAAGHTAPVWHGRTRPPVLEGEATNRAIALATLAGARLYVVHVSCLDALDPLARARAAGLPVYAETCVHYLVLDESALQAPGFEGAKAVFAPPPRAVEHQEHLWRALGTRVLDVVSTDHCAFRYADQKHLGRDDFSKIPNGAPGIEHRLTILHELGVRSGRLSLGRWVELCATAPARLFGLAPRKGAIAVGADADVVVFDPTREQTISAASHHSAVDYSLYEGLTVHGAPSAVLLRGQLVVRDGELVGEPGCGRFTRRA